MRRYTPYFFFFSAVVLFASGVARWSLGDGRRGAFGVTLGLIWFLIGMYYRRKLRE